MKGASPLRYPGGKWRWQRYFQRIISLNALTGTTYVEPYAGGASLALSLLIDGAVSEIHLNDLDRSVFAFWHSAVNENREFVKRVQRTRVCVAEWERQKEVHRRRNAANLFDLGFATFYLNRTNRSGVLNGGIIGGKKQRGEWKIDARFNREDLIERLSRIGRHAKQIHVTGIDAARFIRELVPDLPRSALVYLDPPYYEKGQDMYFNAYRADDHRNVRNMICKYVKQNWIVSYDDIRAVRALYAKFRSRKMQLHYSARSSRIGHEVLFFSNHLKLPRNVAGATA